MLQFSIMTRAEQYIILMIAAVSLFYAGHASAYMNSRMGRFMQRDPIGYVDGMSVYAAHHIIMGGLDPSGYYNVQHHWLPNAFRPIFEETCGISIDKFISFLDDHMHYRVHAEFNYNHLMINAFSNNGCFDYTTNTVDCCCVADMASVIANWAANWLKTETIGGLPPNLPVKTYWYRQLGDGGPAVHTGTGDFNFNTELPQGKPCKQKLPCDDDLKSRVDEMLQSNPRLTPRQPLFNGPYSWLPNMPVNFILPIMPATRPAIGVQGGIKGGGAGHGTGGGVIPPTFKFPTPAPPTAIPVPLPAA